jgi:nucleoid-associated protein YgaU
MWSSSRRRVASRSLLVALFTLVGLAATVAPVSAQAEPADPPETARVADEPVSGVVTVREGETLYGIARRTLGDGARYVEIFALNVGVPQADGGALTDPAVLHVGWRLELPQDDDGVEPPGGGEEPDPDDSQGSGETYTVRPGDTLSGIARSELGDATRYDEIFAINRGRPQTGGGALTDPSVLIVGWVLELPRVGGGGGGGTVETVEYRVVAGDSLSSIAAEELGSAARYPEIFALNEGQPQAVGGALTNPSVLRVGWVLQLPAA